MKKISGGLVPLVLGTIFTMIGCAKKQSAAKVTAVPTVSDPDAVIYVGSTNPPVSLNNIAGGSSGITEALYRNVYEPLLSLEDDGSILPTLSPTYTVSDDGTVYTFKLREGVHFHDGSELTAQDVKYSYERALSPESHAARKTDLAVIDHIEVADTYTVKIYLKQRTQSFDYYTTFVWIVKNGTKDNSATANGTGPYKLVDYQSGTSLSIERFDGYWGDKPKNKKVVFTYFSDSNAETNALLGGQIDLITNIDTPEQLASFSGNATYTIAEGNSTTKQVFAFNDKRAPFNDTRVRQALSRGVNKAAVLKAAWNGYGQLIGSFVPPSDPWYEDLSSINAYDPDSAKKLLAEAGYPNGFTFSLVTPATAIHQLSAQAIKSDLAKIGVTVEIKVIDPSAWYEIVFKNKDYDATLQEHVNDRDLLWYSNPNFYWGYDNAEVQQWAKDAQYAASADEQTAIYKKIAKKIAEEAASSWLFLYPQLRVSVANVTGYPVNGKNSSFFVGKIEKK
ncbi:MAG: ABC transporter substrate-binding protein [Treponema sp.]|nr:ABC transporter substrate-binding protein [Treponema sp.]